VLTPVKRWVLAMLAFARAKAARGSGPDAQARIAFDVRCARQSADWQGRDEEQGLPVRTKNSRIQETRIGIFLCLQNNAKSCNCVSV
jgi:hypothetical protein